ncbi:facilitated trehalose transporter Tret1-like [Phymastichus coffea]|uniref:facilitated trehalose transporter Tret1-like n=1 Tax=Phymastichus coffea TaxID=108790 RepID=UPI00273B6AB1|nr:facilitated trehalose transporter Tret1-like [Phymastichus coffea]
MFQRWIGNIVFPQWLAGLAVTLLLIELSFMTGWTSPALARLTDPNSPILLSTNEASWVASLLNLGRFFGSVVGAVTTEYLGSKKSLLVSLLPIALSWLVMLFANIVELLYFARILGGLGFGMAFATFPLYLGEISMPEIRGALVSMGFCGGQLGMVIASLCGSNMSISSSATMYLIWCLLLMLFYMWLPESPYYLVMTNNCEAAKKSINWYRSGNHVDEELKAVEKFVACSRIKSFSDKLNDLKKPYVRRALFHVIILFFFTQLCGLNSIAFYMETILIRGKSTMLRPATVVVYSMIASVFATMVSLILIDRFGRRILFVASSIGFVCSMFLLSTHFMLLKYDVINIQCLPVISLILFSATIYIGFTTVPSTILSELFPANIKCTASCIASLIGSGTAFLSTKTYQPLVDWIGEAYTFVMYASLVLIMIPYALFIMPETKGKSLLQIQDQLTMK